MGVARNQELLAELKEQLGDAFTPEVADVADPAVATQLIADYRPQTVVLNAGATPPVGSFQEQTWEMFSTNWNVDVQHVFNFTREVLTATARPRVGGRQPVQRGRIGGVAAQRRLRGSQGHYQAHQLLRRARSAAPRADIRFVSVLP